VKIALAGLARIHQAGRAFVEIDGTLVPVVSGGDGPVTVQDLVDERARVLAQIDELHNTIRSENREWTDDDRAEDDRLGAEYDRLSGEIARAEAAVTDADRFERQAIRSQAPAPIVNLIGRASTPLERGSLDELLWATPEAVRASGGNATNPVEQVVVRSDVNDQGALAPRIGSFLPEHRDAIRSLQAFVAKASLAGLLYGGRKGDKAAEGFEIARSIPSLRDEWQHICRALDVDTSGEGGAWVPTGLGSMVHEQVRASGKVAPLFQRIDIPTNPWKLPIEGADATAYRVAEPTGDTESKPTASTPGTVAATFDAEIFGARTLWSRSLDADSAIAMQPFVLRKLVQAFVNAEERAILDGDTDGTHMDTDTHAAGATDAAWAWDGLRKKALAQTVATATSCTALNLGVVRKAMGKWGVNPADLAFIIGVSNLHTLLADTNLLTVDKMGPQAVILNGQIGSVFGVPVIVSEFVRENLNASGVYDAITTTKTYMLCVNRNEWAIGQRMAIDVEVDDSIYRETFQRVGVMFQREDFQSIASAATNDDTAIAYNVTP
jgi:HK97 family phage major capsid protein